MSKTFKIISLGCRTNQYEAQAYRDQLITLGCQPVTEGERADICIVNTCTVTESADSSSRQAIRQLARENEGSLLLVTGCFAERQPDLVRELPGVSYVIPNSEKENLLAFVFPEEELPEFSIRNFEAHTRAFLKVQDGCNSFCTYCIIPYVRGRSRSRSVEDILREAQELLKQGYQEIVLTGINIGDFDGGVEPGASPVRLAELVRLVDALPGLQRLRLSSIDPDEVDDELMSAILDGKKTCPSMHLVLQSGSNVILKRMNRKYTRQVFLETVERLKRKEPDFTLTTDVIVGFPGETDADHQETLEVLQCHPFAKVHMFPYSDRPRTRAALMPQKVPLGVMKARKAELLQVAEQTAFELRQKYIGRKMRVLTEEAIDGRVTGHTDNFLRVEVESCGESLSSNQLIEVDLIANAPHALVGKFLGLPYVD